jgi:thioredoxin-like negative regulator of GroEL
MKKLILFSARYCGKCHAANKRITKMIEKGKYQFEYELVNIEVDKAKVKKFNVSDIPTLICLENGKETKRIKGSILPPFIIELLE